MAIPLEFRRGFWYDKPRIVELYPVAVLHIRAFFSVQFYTKTAVVN